MAADAGFPPGIIDTAMNSGMESFQENMDAGMPPAIDGRCDECWYDAGSEAFGDEMPDFNTIGMDAFNEAIANGASPQEVGEAAVMLLKQQLQILECPRNA